MAIVDQLDYLWVKFSLDDQPQTEKTGPQLYCVRCSRKFSRGNILVDFVVSTKLQIFSPRTRDAGV